MRERRSTPVRIAIVGDFNRHKHSHWATEAALFHAAAGLGLAVAPQWLPTPSIDAQCLAGFDGIFGAPGSPFVSMEGMLRAIEYARQRDVPYLGTCAGFQHALVEFTRNVLGIADADTAENNPNGKNIVITPIQCEAEGPPGLPRLTGIGIAGAVPGTLLAEVCGAGDLRSEYIRSSRPICARARIVASSGALSRRIALSAVSTSSRRPRTRTLRIPRCRGSTRRASRSRCPRALPATRGRLVPSARSVGLR